MVIRGKLLPISYEASNENNKEINFALTASKEILKKSPQLTSSMFYMFTNTYLTLALSTTLASFVTKSHRSHYVRVS